MRLKFGALITEGHGSLGGHTIQNSNYGSQLRSKPVNKKKPTYEQSIIRSLNSTIHSGWRNLTDQQRRIWIKAAPYPLSGSQFWYKCQFTRLHEGLPFLQNPANKLDTYLGSEMIPQSLWHASGLAWWDNIIGTWLGNGVILAYSGDSGVITKYSFFTVNTLYKIVFTCYPEGYRLIAPYSSSPPSINITYPNTYTYFYKPDLAKVMRIYFSGNDGYITYISIKEVYGYYG